ncbi:MAG TPA: hypothetical protein VN841_15020 [Bryobacteraceae bacterium]|nr:hypothetical protein [Bryobacteraceae bacterium]
MNGNSKSRMLLEDDQELRAALRALPRVSPPGLKTSLRVLASRECQRRLTAQQGRWGRLTEWGDRLSLYATNLMRPLALPLAGGVFSAVVLFGVMLGSTYPVHANTHSDLDVPTMLTTSASVKGLGPISSWDDGDVVVVDVSLDDQGRMVDYAIVSGAAVLQDAALRRRLENKLLFTEFVPATAFGVPTTSRLCLRVGASRVEVKG